jgi:hypothetical protein
MSGTLGSYSALLGSAALCASELRWRSRVAYFLVWFAGFTIAGVFERSESEFAAFQYGLALVMLFHARTKASKRIAAKKPNKAPEPTTMAVTIRAPSSTARASHGRGSS